MKRLAPHRIILPVLVSGLLPATAYAGEFKNYLDPPRINIAGRFYSDPSTINNDPFHYDDGVRRPSPWQEPAGRHLWRIVDCSVRSVLGPDGQRRPRDPLVGVEVSSADEPSPAKLVDLDVYQQVTTAIYGFALKIALPGGGELVGAMDPPMLNSAWMTRVLPTRGWNQQYGWGSFGGDANGSGFFQTLIRVPDADWPRKSGSQTLDALREASDVVDGQRLISFRFVLDGYFNVPHHQDFRHGRFTGSLGPGSSAAPERTPGHRWLEPRRFPDDAAWYVPQFYGAPFKVDARRGKLVIDLANSLSMEFPGGVPVDLGDFRAVVHDDDGRPVILGRIDESAFVYEDRSAIVELDLDASELDLLQSRPLSLVTSRRDIGPETLFHEDSSGLHYAVDRRVLRMTSEPGSAWVERGTRVHVTRWGRPVEDFDLRLKIVPVTGSTPGNTGTPGSPGDTQEAWNALEGKISSSDENGFAHVTLRVVADPGRRTPELDGQLYFVYVLPADGEWTAPVEPELESQEHQISVLAWSRYEVKENPTWADVVEIMAPYAKLYPSMTNLIDLTDRHSFEVYSLNPPWFPVYGEPQGYNVDGISAGAIPYMMTREMTDPRFMPVTRDLSPNRIKTVLNWARNAQKGIEPTPSPPEPEGHGAYEGGN